MSKLFLRYRNWDSRNEDGAGRGLLSDDRRKSQQRELNLSQNLQFTCTTQPGNIVWRTKLVFGLVYIACIQPLGFENVGYSWLNRIL